MPNADHDHSWIISTSRVDVGVNPDSNNILNILMFSPYTLTVKDNIKN